MWQHNFGISFNLWDKVFGTYKDVDWKPKKDRKQYQLSEYLKINWIKKTAD
jgi:sterol desaturase/sphingolipid hydroxylase (fatty acid hydroxylase superfamily)